MRVNGNVSVGALCSVLLSVVFTTNHGTSHHIPILEQLNNDLVFQTFEFRISCVHVLERSLNLKFS
jgi:hypothetical protein